MLLEMRVRGVGVLGDVSVRFTPGLNVVSGETGAGKTLVVTSLALLTGGRATSGLVAGSEARLEAVFDADDQLRGVLAGRGLDTDDAELIVSRRITGDGRSRAWIGGDLVPISALAATGEALVQIHGQGAGFALARPQAQLEALDAFAGAHELRATYQTSLRRVRELQTQLQEIRHNERERAREAEMLAFQVAEIDRAGLDPVADAQLPDELARLEHAERLQELGAATLASLSGEAAGGMLAEAAKALQEIGAIDRRAAQLASRAGQLQAEAGELGTDVRRWLEGLDTEPARLAELRERAVLLADLRRKYGSDSEEILRFADEARSRLAGIEGADSRARELSDALDEAGRALETAAAALSARRTEGADRLGRLVSQELPALALGEAAFQCVVEPADEHTEQGADRVAMLFASGSHAEPAPIGKVASGGELSRVMVAVTLALASAHTPALLVFDEADQGVGGQAALDLARRLARLAASHQVVVVTHLPQIAAFADNHLVVLKQDQEVRVEQLTGRRRVAELSRMLAGMSSSQRARAHAAELLEMAQMHKAGEAPAAP